MNNKGFIIYDALISLILLTNFIAFFMIYLQYTHEQKILYSNQIKAIDKLRYNYSKNEEYKCQSYKNKDKIEYICLK